MSLREEEILALIQKRNHDCADNFVAKGSPFVPAKDLGLEDGRNCDTSPSFCSGSQVWPWTGEEGGAEG